MKRPISRPVVVKAAPTKTQPVIIPVVKAAPKKKRPVIIPVIKTKPSKSRGGRG